MKKIIIFLLLIITFKSAGQDMTFLGYGLESEVRLFWLPNEKVPENLAGYNIKRRQGEGEWLLLNESPILPATSSDKLLNNLGLSSNDIERLSAKRSDLIKQNKLTPKDHDEFISFLGQEGVTKALRFVLASDFDLSLIAGFGYVDHPKAKGKFTYGIFPVLKDVEGQVAATYSLDFGTETKFPIEINGEVKAINQKASSVELLWTVNLEDYKKYPFISGFDVFRRDAADQFKKLNENIIWMSTGSKEGVVFYSDNTVQLDNSYTYAIRPKTIFNTFGEYSELEVATKKIPEDIAMPTLEKVDYIQTGFSLDWQFSADKEEFISGFYVEKVDEIDQFQKVSELLVSSTRHFTFTSAAPKDGSYHTFRVVAVRIDGLSLWSNRKNFYYQEDKTPSAPQNLSAEIIQNGQKRFVRLNWNKPNKNLNHVSEYKLYSRSPWSDHLVQEGSIEIHTTTYDYEVANKHAATYGFAVSALTEDYFESPLSDSISILVPSLDLPFVEIWPIAKENKVITLNWKYPDNIIDLAGFRLYQNGEIIADENQLGPEARQWVSSAMTSGKYSYQLEAVSESEVKSNLSKPRNFDIE
ncbi:hypothetical protein [Fulvivirga ligni]|uniref:hypothetical protein n=1 Tax=Fulvivirga ligni TaxID=2904246 RepID=UPI001F16F749|nr:hypothetical protein [Fulvivirga ligni]UII20014.1 hypothetical protein LVD16_19400 [Fulvivirga ligni]